MLHKLVNRLLRRPVVYDDSFFAEVWFAEWATLRMVLAKIIEVEPKWRKIVDFGCGPGVMIDLMTDHGFDYIGCDYSAEARSLYLEHYGKYPDCYLTNLDEAGQKNFDLLIAFDVLEHMHDAEIASFLGKVNLIPELLLNISRTRGIPGHVNIKSDRAWIEFMKKQDYYFEENRTSILRQVYSKLRPGSPDRWDRNLFLFSRVKL